MTDARPPARRPDHAIDPRFLARWSPRAFSGRAVSEAEVMQLLEAARWAPSASNHQPWRFVWALRGEAAFAAIHGALVPFNQEWAGHAGALIVVAAKTEVSGRDGVEKPNRWAEFDAGAAWMSLALQAEAMGLVAHAMGGFDEGPLAAAVHLPVGHTLLAVVAVGERGPAEGLPEALRAREMPNTRRPLAETVQHGRF
jgi:nitroreductase